MIKHLFLLLFSAAAVAQNSSTPLDSALIACYPFSGNANDYSGNGNNGTVNGAVLTSDRFGNASSAYSFNGQQNISVPNFNTLVNGNGFSISFWAANATSATRSAFLLSPDDPNNRINVHVYYLGTTYWDFGNIFSNGRLYVAQGNTPPANTWDHWVFTVGTSGSGFMRIYRNGVLFGSQNSYSPYLNQGTANMLIGGGVGANSSNLWFMGTLDDVRFYRRSLTQTDVTALFTATSACACSPAAAPLITTPVQNLSVCVGQTATLSASSTNTVNWFAAGNFTQSLGTGLAYYPVAGSVGTFSYYAIATNSCQSGPAAQVVLTVNPTSSLLTGPAAASCRGQSAMLSASLSSGSGSLFWYDSPQLSNLVGSGGNYAVPPTFAAGSYTFYVTSNAFCVNNSPLAVPYTVYPLPTLSLNIASYTVCQGQSVLASVSGASQYTWSTAQTTSVVVLAPANSTAYSVTGSSNGCSTTNSFSITVTLCTGLQSVLLDMPRLSIYPNPGSGHFSVEYPGFVQPVDMVILDLTGKVVAEGQLTGAVTRIDLQLPAGIYELRLGKTAAKPVKLVIRQ